MVLTFGRRRPRSSPVGDYQAVCADCGTPWYRSQMSKDSRGILLCRYCNTGRSELDMAQEQAAAAGAPFVYQPRDGGGSDEDDGL